MKPRCRCRKRILVVLVAVSCLLLQITLFSVSAAASEVDHVSVSELIRNMEEYNGRSVTITGEVVGDIMVRDDHAWITVNDGSYSKSNLEQGGEFSGVSNIGIGVWAPRQEVRDIENLGGYTKKGDTVEVVGVFHRACPEHGGDTDIHATSIRLLGDGFPIKHPLDYKRLLLATALVGLAVFLLSMWLKRRTLLGEE